MSFSNNINNTTGTLGVSRGGTNLTATPTNGQIPIGNGTDYTLSTLGAGGGNISVTNASGSITLNTQQRLLYRTMANNDASITFNNLSYENPFRIYFITFRAVVPATDGATLRMECSNDNGATWFNTDYKSGINYSDYDTATMTNSNSTTNCVFTPPLDNGISTSGGNGYFYWFTRQANEPFFFGQISCFNNTTNDVAFGTCGGKCGHTGVNAFKFFMSSGNITTGEFSIYGIQNDL